MKKVLFLIFFIFFIISVFLFISNKKQMVVRIDGNYAMKPLPIKLGHYQDSDCGMVINDLSFAAEVVATNGATWFFHDLGGMVHWIENKTFKNKAKLWVRTLDSKKWIDAKKAWYSRVEKTPMGYGFGAYEKNKKGLVSFEKMRILMLRGETLNNPKIRNLLLGNN